MKTRSPALVLDGRPLSLDDVEQVARAGRRVELGRDARARIDAAREVVVRHAADRQPIYGINTGFGSLSRQRIDPQQLAELQRNLVRSHAAGIGEPLADDSVRAMMLILAASLCRGFSGVRVEVVDQLLSMLNAGVIPVVPSRGSVGASGDLAPLAHLALVLIGEGQAKLDGQILPGAEALRAAALTPMALQAKEGLALINGTHMMAALGSLALRDVERLTDAALVACAMAIDACRATDSFLDARLHEARGQAGQQQVAQRLRAMLEGSQIVASHRDNDPRVQDPYGLRAAPQVLGAAFDAIAFTRDIVERELGAVTDNPLVFATDREAPAGPAIVSGGNFHGMPLAIALDVLKIALCHVAGIAERRVFWALSAADPESHLPAYLSPQPGLHSGLMIAQYTAAACCNEMQTLAGPASVANISTSAGIEDYNSMGATSAHQAKAAVDLATHVVAIELLVMAEGLERHRPLRSGAAVEQAFEKVRQCVPRLTADRPPAPDIATLVEQINRGSFEKSIAFL
jgi:histidine ammonia-lyase